MPHKEKKEKRTTNYFTRVVKSRFFLFCVCHLTDAFFHSSKKRLHQKKETLTTTTPTNKRSPKFRFPLAFALLTCWDIDLSFRFSDKKHHARERERERESERMISSLAPSVPSSSSSYRRRERGGHARSIVAVVRSHHYSSSSSLTTTTTTTQRRQRNFRIDDDDADDDINKNDGASRKRRRRRARGRRVVVEATTEDKTSSTAEEVEEITKKWGLEAGLWKIFNNKETKKNTESTAEGEGDGTQLSGSRMDMAKQLLKTYGSAYLITSISLSLVSFGVFYVLVSSGVDVAALLSIIGITATQNSEKVGTVAIAYAAHKAASPIRFPPTVALTPIVAGWMGKTGKKAEEEEEGEEEEK